jgi:hypothetical protein
VDFLQGGNVLKDVFEIGRLNKHVWRDKGQVTFTGSLLMTLLEVAIQGDYQ